MNINRVYDRVVASYATGIRGDLSIADFQKLDSTTAHVLMEYEPSLGRPKGDDIERYFAKTFENKILPIMSSCSIKNKAISVVAKINVQTRPIEDSQDKKKLLPIIAGLMYLDNELGEHWEVSEKDGKKLLAKTNKDNIEQIIAARRNRMFVTKTPSVSLASLATAKELISAGDTVRAWHQGTMIEATVLEPIKSGFKVKTDKEFIVAKESVLDLQQQAADKGPNEAAKLEKYFAEAYGDKNYAKQLVKKSK